MTIAGWELVTHIVESKAAFPGLTAGGNDVPLCGLFCGFFRSIVRIQLLQFILSLELLLCVDDPIVFFRSSGFSPIGQMSVSGQIIKLTARKTVPNPIKLPCHEEFNRTKQKRTHFPN